MVSLEVNAVLAWLHILAAVGWMGTAMFLAMVLTPSMRTFSAGSRSEVMLKLFPRIVKYTTGFATLTLVAGVLLAFGIVGSNLSSFSPTRGWGFEITVGALLALASYVLALGVGLRSARKIVKILSANQDPEKPPPEIAGLQRRMRLTASTVVALLMLSLVFMVAAARL